MEVSSSQLLLGWSLLVLFTCGTIIGLRLVLKYLSMHNHGKPEQKFAGRYLISNRTKYPAVDGSRFSSGFMFIGLAVALAFSLLTISWTQFERPVYTKDSASELEDLFVVIPITGFLPPSPPQIREIIEVPKDVTFAELPVVDQSKYPDDNNIAVDSLVEMPIVAKPKVRATPPPVKPVIAKVPEIFTIAEQMPRFPGCEDLSGTNAEKYRCAEARFLEYIYKKVKYPSLAKENGIQGPVTIQFVVEIDGQITNAEIVRDIGAGCGEEVLRAVDSMNSLSTPWTPGKQRGEPVRVRFSLPVSFKLN